MSPRPLVDRFGRSHTYLRVSLTDRCNFRCQYCMPEEGIEWKPKEQILRLEEVESLVRLFVKLGVDKVRLTGGEPTLRKGYIDLVRALSPFVAVHLTTNGSALGEHADALRWAGLSSVNVSCDSLRPDRFAEITRRDALNQVLRGIQAAKESGILTKVNVVVMRGWEDEVADFVDFAADQELEVRFIEFMPFLGNQWRPDLVVPFEEIKALATSRRTIATLPGHPTDVAQPFVIEGANGTLGFIASVTNSFCGGCNRLRLTAEGQLKTCLFLPPRSSLRDLLRSGATDEEIEIAVRQDLETKWEQHPPMNRWAQKDILSMVQIGG